MCHGHPADTNQDDAASTRLCPPRTVSRCQPTIAVVGGSLAGPVAALLLVRAGFDRVTVYEATPAAAPQHGGLITLEHSALDILDRLDVPQPEYVKFPTENTMHIKVCDRRPVETVRRTYPGRLTTWTLLHRALMARMPTGLLRTGARVTGLVEQRGRPLLQFADGRAECVDLVMFADGRSSVGRALLDPGRRLRYAGYVAHRGAAPNPPADLRDFLRFEPCPGVQFNVAPVPEAADWTFYLNATDRQYTAWFGAPPSRRVFALPQHVTPAARHLVDGNAEAHLPAEQAAIVHATPTRMAAPGDGHRPTHRDGVAGRTRARRAPRRRPGTGAAPHRPRRQQRHRTGRRARGRPDPAPPLRRRPGRRIGWLAAPASGRRGRRRPARTGHRRPARTRHRISAIAARGNPRRPGASHQGGVRA